MMGFEVGIDPVRMLLVKLVSMKAPEETELTVQQNLDQMRLIDQLEHTLRTCLSKVQVVTLILR